MAEVRIEGSSGSEMVDRVTAAILPAFEHIADPQYRSTIAGCWARAAIEAMRVPTEKMLKGEGWNRNAIRESIEENLDHFLAEDVWIIMIGEALK